MPPFLLTCPSVSARCSQMESVFPCGLTTRPETLTHSYCSIRISTGTHPAGLQPPPLPRNLNPLCSALRPSLCPDPQPANSKRARVVRSAILLIPVPHVGNPCASDRLPILRQNSPHQLYPSRKLKINGDSFGFNDIHIFLNLSDILITFRCTGIDKCPTGCGAEVIDTGFIRFRTVNRPLRFRTSGVVKTDMVIGNRFVCVLIGHPPGDDASSNQGQVYVGNSLPLSDLNEFFGDSRPPFRSFIKIEVVHTSEQDSLRR